MRREQLVKLEVYGQPMTKVLNRAAQLRGLEYWVLTMR